MAHSRGSLCSRCGSPRWIEVSDREIRCAECGLGATRSVLRAVKADGHPMSAEARNRLVDSARERARQAARLFADAPFRPYGLDDRWRGLRWFGGWGSSDGVTNRLELAHGDEPWSDTSPLVRIETFAVNDSGDHLMARQMTYWDATRHLVQHFWHETGVLHEEVRRAVFANDRTHDPTAPWDSTSVPIDGLSVDFRVLGYDEFRVALGTHDDAIVAVRARHWPLRDTRLVTVEEFAPYVDGAIETRRRWPT